MKSKKMKNILLLTLIILLIIPSIAFGDEVKDRDYFDLKINELSLLSKNEELLSLIDDLKGELNSSNVESNEKAALLGKLNALYNECLYEVIRSEIRAIEYEETSEDVLTKLNDLKKKVSTSQMTSADKATLTGDINSLIIIMEEELFNNLLSSYRDEKTTEVLISTLNQLRDRINKSSLSKDSKDKLISSLNDEISRVDSEIGLLPKNMTADSLKKEMKLSGYGNGFFIELPRINENYTYEYIVRDKESNVKIAEGSTDTIIELPLLKEKATVDIVLSIINNISRLEEKAFTVSILIEDNEKPVINFAYVEDGKLYLDYSDNMGLEDNTILIQNEVNYEKKVTYTNKGIDVKIPSKTTIKIRDIFGNELEQTLDIQMDNYILLGSVNNAIAKRLEDKSISDIKKISNYDNIITLEMNKKINIYEEFKGLIRKKYGKYNDGDIKITSNDFTIGNDGYALLNKEGLSSFEVSHSFYNKDVLKIYALVDGGGVKYTNIKKMELINPFFIYSDSVNLKDLLRVNKINDLYDANFEYVLVRNLDTGEITNIDEGISMEDDKVLRFEIIDVLNEMNYPVEIKREYNNEVQLASYKDVSSNHWAFYHIKNLTLNGVINGYTDGTFKPDSNISILEFTNLLSKYMAKLDIENIKPIKNDYRPITDRSNWAYIGVRSVYNRLSNKGMERMGTTDLGRKITRDEVAFLISNTLNLNNLKEVSYKEIKDLSSSKNSLEVRSLLGVGVLSGYPDGTFRPNDNITRAEIASIFNKLSNLHSQGE